MKFRPKTDHTTNSTEGWYLLADGAPGRAGDITSLVSTQISATHARCALDFWVFFGTFSDQLLVYAGKGDQEGKQLYNSDTALLGSE